MTPATLNGRQDRSDPIVPMALLKTIKNSVLLLAKGEWREFYIRAPIVLGLVDIKTTTCDELELPEARCHSYFDSGRSEQQKTLPLLDISAGGRIVDFGCGKGGALIVFAAYIFAKITGVEISRKLVDIARKKLDRLRLDLIEIACCTATCARTWTSIISPIFSTRFPVRSWPRWSGICVARSPENPAG